MNLHHDRDRNEYHCDTCGQVYRAINNDADSGKLIYAAGGVTHVFPAGDGCHRCKAMEENERMAKPISKELADALEAQNRSYQPRAIGRMRLRYSLSEDGKGHDLIFECTDCKAIVLPDDNTTDGVITAWDEEYHDCPYCVSRELREADMTTLPDFGAF